MAQTPDAFWNTLESIENSSLRWEKTNSCLEAYEKILLLFSYFWRKLSTNCFKIASIESKATINMLHTFHNVPKPCHKCNSVYIQNISCECKKDREKNGRGKNINLFIQNGAHGHPMPFFVFIFSIWQFILSTDIIKIIHTIHGCK